MFRYFVKRIFYGIFVILGLSIIIFVLARIVPGDPARFALGDRASQEAVDNLRTEMHLDEPVFLQYYYWFSDLLKGDLGISFNTKRRVVMDVKQFLPATLEILVVSLILKLIFAFIFGILSVKYKDKWGDDTVRVISYIGISVPAFVWAGLFLLFFGFIWPVLPVFGRLSKDIVPPTRVTGIYIFDYLIVGNFAGALNAISHVFLPALSLSIGHIFQEARILRSSLIDNMSKEYITVALGYGIPQNRILTKYLLKPSAIPWITVAGLDFAATMGNAFLVESIFNWPGLSRYGLNAMLNKDLNSISAVILVIGLIFLLTNIFVDLTIAALNPQVRLGD